MVYGFNVSESSFFVQALRPEVCNGAKSANKKRKCVGGGTPQKSVGSMVDYFMPRSKRQDLKNLQKQHQNQFQNSQHRRRFLQLAHQWWISSCQCQSGKILKNLQTQLLNQFQNSQCRRRFLKLAHQKLLR